MRSTCYSHVVSAPLLSMRDRTLRTVHRVYTRKGVVEGRMNTQIDPTALALKIALRSSPGPNNRYQIGAVIVEWGGRILSWGWNHPHEDRHKRSVHAEEHALARANPRRLNNAAIYVAGLRSGTGRIITARPCTACGNKLLHAGLTRFIFTREREWAEERHYHYPNVRYL